MPGQTIHHDQGFDGFAAHAAHGLRLVADPHVDQGQFGRLAVVTEQVDHDVGAARRTAAPDRRRQVRPEGSHAFHPAHGQRPQGGQFLALGIGAEHGDVLEHRIFDFFVVGQGGTGRQAQDVHGLPLGRAIFKPIFDHQSGRAGGNLGLEVRATHVHHRDFACLQGSPARRLPFDPLRTMAIADGKLGIGRALPPAVAARGAQAVA